MIGKQPTARIAERLPIVLGLVIMTLAALSAPGWGVQLTFPDTTMTRGDTIDIPLYTEDLTGLGVVAYEVHFIITTTNIQPVDVIEAGTLTSGWGDAVWSLIGSEVRIVSASITPLTGSGVLFYVRMTAPLTGTGSSNLNLTYGMFNEGTPEVTLDDGHVSISNPPYITVNPNTATLTRGDSLLFYTNYGTPPYTYYSTDPSVASIDLNTGWLHALSRGITRVAGEDVVGIRDTTGNIVVRDLKLTIRDTTILTGQIFDLPVYATDVTGLGILSGEFAVTWSSGYMQVLDVLETGTMVASWGNVTQNILPGQLDVSFAGTTPLSGSGVLMILRCQITSPSGGFTMYIQNPLFNEVIESNVDNGYISITAAPNLNISPNTASLVVGDSLQFTLYGGATPPVTWGTTDPGVATITSSGMLHAIAGGEVLVTAVDDLGFTDSSETITVCDFTLEVAWVESPSDRAIEVPITLVGDATGLGVLSFEMTLSYNDDIAWADSLIQAGTMTSSWFPGVLNTYVNGADLAMASVSPLSGGNATLVIVEFYVNPSATIGQYTNVNITNLLFNEGDVCAAVTNGRVTVIAGNPDPVADLVIVRNGTSVMLDWSDVALRDGYNVYRYLDAGLTTLDNTWLDVSDEDPMTPRYQWTDPTADLTTDVQYFYIVRSFLN